ncbi:MAG: hypothetical protein IJU69_02935 [Bacteroidales bacterium]|nr:hypothetical protein [Bacteroidales bacterium]
MAQEKIKKDEALQESIMEEAAKGEQFYNEHKGLLWGILIAVAVIGLGILGYIKFIYQPQAEEAQAQMYPAETAFAKEEWESALNGDGNNAGFAQVIEDYGCKAPASVYLYAGVCELQLEKYQEALDYLKKYNGKDALLKARSIACQGDAYVGLGEQYYAQAVKCYADAAACANNVFAADYIVKEGLTYEAMKQYDKALECFNDVRLNYSQSTAAYDIDKYIARVTIKKEGE